MAKHLSKTFKPLFEYVSCCFGCSPLFHDHVFTIFLVTHPFSRVLVERAQAQTKSAGGLLLPTASKVNEGVVLAVGAGVRNNVGDFLPLSVAVGQKVLLPEFGGVRLNFEDKEATLFRYDEILGVMNN
jgi:chaperonin GroES